MRRKTKTILSTTHDSISHLHRVASHQIIVISSFTPFHRRWLHVFVSIVELAVIFFGQRELIHGYTQAVIFALHVTMGGSVHCQFLKHVTLKNVIIDDILIDNKLEVLTIYCWLRLFGVSELRYQQHRIQIAKTTHGGP